MKTLITVNEPIKVPNNNLLAPGKYVLKLLDSPSDRHIVQIFNADDNQLITTVLAIPNYRLQPTGNTVLTFCETPPGQPKVLRAWFYPGDNFGQEFAYSRSEAGPIAAASRQTVLTTEATKASELPSAPVSKTQPQQVSLNTPPPRAPSAPARQIVTTPQVAPAPEPASQQTAAPRELPKTAGPYPLFGLAGIFSLGIFTLIRAYRLS